MVNFELGLAVGIRQQCAEKQRFGIGVSPLGHQWRQEELRAKSTQHRILPELWGIGALVGFFRWGPKGVSLCIEGRVCIRNGVVLPIIPEQLVTCQVAQVPG